MMCKAIQEQLDIQEAIDSLKFLKSLLKIKNFSNKICEFVISDQTTTARLNLKDEFFNLRKSYLSDHVIDLIKNSRLANPILFNAIEPSQLTEKQVQEAIERLTPKHIYKPSFQIAHHSWKIVEYLNNELENRANPNPTSNQLRLIFEFLWLFKISHHIIPENRLPDKYFVKERRNLIRDEMKKLLENHRKSANGSYKNILKKI